MAKGKPPVLDLDSCDDQRESVELWLDKFNDWCTLQGWRDTSKDASDNSHWKPEHYASEISAFRLALPIKVWKMVKSSLVPKMSNDEVKQPWQWQKKFTSHYSGQDLILAQRMTFMDTCKQKPQESISDFEARCKYHGSKCEYEKMTDPQQELIRDRFVTGVYNDKLRAELLRHKRDDGTIFTLDDVVTKAKSWEAANRLNTQVIESHHTEEQVNSVNRLENNTYKTRNASRPPKPSAPTTRASNQCQYCGQYERHTRRTCPAGKPGVHCRNCYGENHFSVVCRSPKGYFKQKWLAKQNQRQKNINAVDGVFDPNKCTSGSAMQQPSSSDDELTHDYTFILDRKNCIHVVDGQTSGKMCVSLSLSSDGSEFQDCSFQVDSAASCNTLPPKMYNVFGGVKDLKPSHSILRTYSGKSIKPLGKTTLLCESNMSYNLLDFEVVANSEIEDRPALLGVKDSVKLGLIKFDPLRVKACTNDSQDSLHIVDDKKFLPEPLTKEVLLSTYKDSFKGLGDLGTPVSFVMNENVTAVHAPVHRIPVAKRQRTKAKLDEMVKCGKLSKVDEPTEWCSNMTVVERKKSNGDIKTRICLDPSQTINKGLIVPKYTIPTLQEILPHFSSKKHKTFTIMDALDGFTQVRLDDQSTKLTTMHTPWGRYKWNRLPYGVSSGVEEFQRRIHEAIDGLSGTLGIADDIVIYGLGDTPAEAELNHDKNLIAFMRRAEERKLKLNPEKNTI